LFVVTVIERGAEQMVFREYSCRGNFSFCVVTFEIYLLFCSSLFILILKQI